MRPAQGDSVKFTDRFLSNSIYNWTSALKDVELLVAKLSLSLIPRKTYTVFFMVNNMMYKIAVSETGHFVDPITGSVSNDIVFEPFQNSANFSVTSGAPLSPQPVSIPTPAWVPNAPTQPSRPVTREEANSTSPRCGAPAVDLIFSVKCTNSDCSNHR